MRRALTLGLLLTASCGARSALEEPGQVDGGNGAIGPSAGGGPAGPTTGGGGSAPCVGFVVDGEPFTIPAGQNATEPEVGLTSDGNAFVAWLSQDQALVGDATLTPSSSWPDPFSEISIVTPSATAFVMGPGTSGPMAYFRDDSANAGLLSGVFGGAQELAAFSTSESPVFVAGSDGGALFGSELFGLLDVRSHTNPEGLMSVGPMICLETPLLAAAIPEGADFVAVFADSAAPGQSCFAQTPQSGLNLVTMY